MKEATTRLDEFIKDHPEAKISDEAEDQLKVLRNREAKKSFDIGQFYESQDQYKSAVIYYRKVVDNYLDSDYYNASIERIQELNKLIKGDMTKKDLIAIRKKEAAQNKRAEKIRTKERKRDKKQEIRQNKIDRKKSLREEAKRAKQLRISEKLALKAEAKAKKKALREEKIEQKQKRILVKKELKEQRRRAKILKKQKARAKKLAAKEKKRKEKLARDNAAKAKAEEKESEND